MSKPRTVAFTHAILKYWFLELPLSRSCKGVNSKKHPRNIRAGYDYNPALQNLQCLILGLTD